MHWTYFHDDIVVVKETVGHFQVPSLDQLLQDDAQCANQATKQHSQFQLLRTYEHVAISRTITQQLRTVAAPDSLRMEEPRICQKLVGGWIKL